MATCSETTETDIGAQNDADKLSASYLRTHPIIEYLGGIVVQAAQSGAELDLFSLSLKVVEQWCKEAEKHCPTEPGVIHMPNLSVLIERIPEEHQWWIPLNGASPISHFHDQKLNYLLHISCPSFCPVCIDQCRYIFWLSHVVPVPRCHHICGRVR